MSLRGRSTADTGPISVIYGLKCMRKIVADQWSNRRRNQTWNGCVTERRSSATREWLGNSFALHQNIAKALVSLKFAFTHRKGLPVRHLRCKFGCCAGCLRWLWRPWVTKILFQALHNSHVDFSRSRDASNSEDCSIRCARPRAFQKTFDHQIWAFGSKVITILLLSICIVTHFSDFDGRIRVKYVQRHAMALYLSVSAANLDNCRELLGLLL